LLRVADALDYDRTAGLSLEAAEVRDRTLTLTLKGTTENMLEVLRRKASLFEKVYGLKLLVRGEAPPSPFTAGDYPAAPS